LFLEPQRYFWFLGYIFVFIWEWLKANINIAAKLIQPTLDIEPAIIEIKTSLKTDIALTILANTLTLTLGTITLDVDAKNKCLYLHCIESQNAKALDAHSLAVFKRFERIIAKIFE
jgi:multicomponent Na+:H+ antiporter subunit E